MIANGDDLGAEIHSDGGNIVVPKSILFVLLPAETRDYVGLADPRIAHDDYLDHVVIDIPRLTQFDVLLEILKTAVVQMHSELSSHFL